MKLLTTLGSLALASSLAACAPAATDKQPDSAGDRAASEAPGKADGWWFFDDEPFADMYNATASVDFLPVRGRLIDEDEDDIGSPDLTPLSQLSQDEMNGEPVSIRLVTDAGKVHVVAELKTDDEGYLDAVVDISRLGVSPGRHAIEVWFEEARVGEAAVTLLAGDRIAPVVRSDVDLTYLFTDFHGFSAMIELLKEDAHDKEALFAMPEVYRALRGPDAHPVTFLSGSPRFFKRTLESKMILDSVEQDGLVLKPFKDIAVTDILGLDFGDIVGDLEEQIGYKLHSLLTLRQQLPDATPEVLMGDDSEADFVAYNLYARLLGQEISASDLRGELEALEVSAMWLESIVELASALKAPAPPVAIYINLTATPGDTYDIEDWTLDGLTRAHEGAWPLALDLFEEDLIDAAAVETVKAALMAEGEDKASLEARAMAADYLDPQTLERF